MMGYVMGILILLSVFFSIALDRTPALSAAALTSSIDAIKLCLELCGTLAMWSGIMRIAEKSGLCGGINKLLSPITNLLFRGLKEKSPKALSAISLNITANILGLGSAATPMALEAMTELDRINGHSDTASNYMIVFVALNTASIQILPTTVATLRAAGGSDNPMEILPAVLITSALSATAAVGSAMLLRKSKQKGMKRSVKLD